MLCTVGCTSLPESTSSRQPPAEPDYALRNDQTHNKFSRLIEPAVRVPSGSIIEAFANEATCGQFTIDSKEPTDVNVGLVHKLTGPIYVEGAKRGDILAVELLENEAGDWGWMTVIPDFCAPLVLALADQRDFPNPRSKRCRKGVIGLDEIR